MTKRKPNTPEQIIRKSGEADTILATGKNLGHVCQALEMSESPFHPWRNQYGGMKAEAAQRLKPLYRHQLIGLSP